ncbi:MAG: hypothetical protein EOO00_14030, partial [Chitinophagaceae bacterium]
SLISMENGRAIPYSINKLQDRGKFFVDPRNGASLIGNDITRQRVFKKIIEVEHVCVDFFSHVPGIL